MSNPIKIISQFSGYLNHLPSFLYITVYQDSQKQWRWDADLYWDTRTAVDKKLTIEVLLQTSSMDFNEDQIEAQKRGYEFAKSLGFTFEKEIQ